MLAGACTVGRHCLKGRMKSFFWLLFKAAIFFLLFAFAMGNRDEVALHFMPGHVVTMPMMAVVLGSRAARARQWL